ncbi:DUF6162 family protein [Halopseudomonas pelagia]|uniref:DUF6162 family protein n=1 Tax=Halopseudomonas pelagia TaxID=553151 RepID=UPI00039CDF58|nr:DUF6162 family protein [Halopseudomonas pelagia]|tara:strand:- start:62070 stop:62636 length:567 start_codon:yes stop_codon:yes gene_type:complete
MTAQVIRPAGAGHETLWVLLLCLLILLGASGVVLSHAKADIERDIASYQLDARMDLTAAEQGVHTDLGVAFEEMQWYLTEQGQLPSPAEMATEGFPPFIDDASASNRGGHQWHRLQLGSEIFYLGQSRAHDIAGTFLLWPQASEAEIWLTRDSDINLPTTLTTDQLIAAGWRQVVAHFDAGVTRQHRH